VARAQDGFAGFLDGVRAEALRAGIRGAVVDEAFAGVQPNGKVMQLDTHQPEFTLTWAQYKARALSKNRFDKGSAAYAKDAGLLYRLTRIYPADPRIVIGIWGLESGFGAHTGTFRVVESLATLAYDGHRKAFFRVELLNALRILNSGDISAHAMTGSYAGAMGQPQFMPSSYLRYAVDADGDGRRDIWTNRADVFGSVANYLAKCGWRAGEPWAQPIIVPDGFAADRTGRDISRTLGAWQAMGVRRIDGRVFSRNDVFGAVVMPDGAGGEAFMTYPNFKVIRRYNASDYYALAVGLLANHVA
jgi:membrane-bound lytic murein transglycosylase B